MRILWGFIRKEFLQTLRDPRMRLLLFIAPCVQLTIFGVALSTEAKNIRLSLVAAPGDTGVQELHRRALASGWFVPARVSVADPFAQIQKNEADAVLIAPPGGLERSIGRGEGSLQLLINATNVTRAQSVERYLQNILLQGQVQRVPVHFDVRVLYNPAMKTSIFLVPGVMSLLVCLITILLTSMSISKEKESGTFETLISAPVSPEQIIMGKTVPFVVLGISNIPLIVAVAVTLFGVPVRGSLAVLMLCSLVFVLCTVGIGLFISTVARNQQQSMMGGFLYLFPSVLLSGLVFPVENMPWVLRVFAYVNPLTYFIEILRNIMLKGGDGGLIASNLLILLAMAVLVIFASWRKFKTTLS